MFFIEWLVKHILEPITTIYTTGILIMEEGEDISLLKTGEETGTDVSAAAGGCAVVIISPVMAGTSAMHGMQCL